MVDILIVVGGLVGFLLLVVLFYVSRLKMPKPGEALIVYGSVGKGEGGGLKIITDGSAFVWPGIQRYTTFPLTAMPFNVATGGIRTKDGIYVQIEAPTTLKVGDVEESISVAARMFAGKSTDQIVEVARKTLEGHLRAICAKMTLTELNEDRKRLQQEMEEVSASDFAKMGLQIVNFNIEKIVDEEGILLLMGKQQAAEQKASTDIGIANATRESAQRVAEANKAAEIAKITAAQAVADAKKDLDLKEARNQQEVATAKAVTDQSYALQELEVKQQLIERQAAVDQTKTEKDALLADSQRELTRKKLVIDVEEPALAEKRKQQILAEAKVLEAEQAGRALLVRREAEGSAEALYLKTTAAASAEKAEIEASAQARAAQIAAQAQAEAEKIEGSARAEVTKATGAAEADAIKSKGLAEAEVGHAQAKVVREKGLAEAEVERSQGVAKAEVEKAMAEAVKAKGLAEADVTLATAEAVKAKGLAEAEALKAIKEVEVQAEVRLMQAMSETMTENMVKYHLVQKMPEIIAAFAGVFPKIDKYTVVDVGGGQGRDGMNSVDRFGLSVARVFGTLVPMVENLTGVEVGKTFAEVLRSPEGQAAVAEAGLSKEAAETLGEVMETLRFPGGKTVTVAQVQQVLDANPEMAAMALSLLDRDVAATEEE